MVTHDRLPDVLQIDIDAVDGVQIVRLTGDLDLTAADRVRSTLIGTGGSTVVVDLSGLEFIDSSGLSALITARRRAASAGTRLVLRGARGAARRVFEVSGLDDVLEEGPGEGD